MELQIKKWGVLRDSTIPLPGLTVIGGYNATGKSTVGKLLLAMVNTSQARWTFSVNGEKKSNSFVPGDFSEVFGQLPHGGSASIVDGNKIVIQATDRGDGIFETDGEGFSDIRSATMIESPFVAVLCNLFQQVQQAASVKGSFFSEVEPAYPYSMNRLYGSLLNKRRKVGEKQQAMADVVASHANGHLVFENSGVVFVEKEGDEERRLDPKTTASGQLGLSIFAKLLENGWIAKDTITIFDEPESHMHPHWQLIYADMLVRCVEELGATIVVTTHTPYMLQALKVFSDQSIKDKAVFCIAERKDDYARISVDNTSDLAKIAPLMTEPMRRIQILRDWDNEAN